jgi:hypothetical protein
MKRQRETGRGVPPPLLVISLIFAVMCKNCLRTALTKGGTGVTLVDGDFEGSTDS